MLCMTYHNIMYIKRQKTKLTLDIMREKLFEKAGNANLQVPNVPPRMCPQEKQMHLGTAGLVHQVLGKTKLHCWFFFSCNPVNKTGNKYTEVVPVGGILPAQPLQLLPPPPPPLQVWLF